MTCGMTIFLGLTSPLFTTPLVKIKMAVNSIKYLLNIL